MNKRLTAGLFAVLVLALAAFTGSAFAGGGNGSESSNGNSANAPGHQDPAAPAATPAAPAAAAPAAKPKHVSAVKQSKQSSTSASAPASGGDNSKGVKPSSTTKHDTYAKASSDQTKQYGNGKTAGQIATKAGYGDATLHGPGNSQPHKALCGGHEVDVHALAHKGSKCATATSAPAAVATETKSETKTEVAPCATTTKTVTEQVAVGVKHMIGPKGSGRYVVIHPSLKSAHYDKAKHADDVVIYETVTKTVSVPAADCASSQAPTVLSSTVTPASAGAVAAATAAAPTAQAAPATAAVEAAAAPAATQGTVAPAATQVTAAPAVSAGGVKGAVIALHPTKAKPAGGVLGATTRLGGTVASAKLPFTGLPLWIFTLVAASLIGLGVLLRRSAADQI